jgi:hypothetical protein
MSKNSWNPEEVRARERSDLLAATCGLYDLAGEITGALKSQGLGASATDPSGRELITVIIDSGRTMAYMPPLERSGGYVAPYSALWLTDVVTIKESTGGTLDEWLAIDQAWYVDPKLPEIQKKQYLGSMDALRQMAVSNSIDFPLFRVTTKYVGYDEELFGSPMCGVTYKSQNDVHAMAMSTASDMVPNEFEVEQWRMRLEQYHDSLVKEQ